MARFVNALQLTAPRTLHLANVPRPAASPGHTVLDVEIAGIGGSESLAYANPGIRPLPNVMGHGIAGTTPDGLRVAVFPLRGCGACEPCRRDEAQLCDDWSLIGVQSDGGFQQALAVPDDALVPLPEGLSWEQAAFVEPFANAINAWARAHPREGERVAVIGLGGLGLGLVAAGARVDVATHVADPSAARRDAARQLGAATHTAALSGSFDVVFDTVGSTASRRAALDATRKGGRCVLMGFAERELSFDANAFIRTQRSLLGAFVYTRAQFESALDLASRCEADWVHGIAFGEVESLLERQLAGDFAFVKAALRPLS